ncbi:MAG TPA: immunoglobulin domain-containing protein, partial [Clostridia bacterium]|nr:immunoglobulin domain-containing protein [Clostridia bacterium]
MVWGLGENSQTNVPSGLTKVVGVAAGGFHSLALQADGRVVAWGWDGDGQVAVPPGLSKVTAVAGGDFHSLALKADGTVVAWGENGYGQGSVPVGLSDVIAIAAAADNNLALKADGTVTAWGRGYGNQTGVDLGLTNIKAIAAGGTRHLALKSDGTVLAWGESLTSRTNVPPGLANVSAIAAGGFQNLVLTSEQPLTILRDPFPLTSAIGARATFTVAAVGRGPLSYQWFLYDVALTDSAHIGGSSTSTLTISNVQKPDLGAYWVRVSNVFGSVDSKKAYLAVPGSPVITTQPSDQTARAGVTVIFSTVVGGSQPLSYQWHFNGSDIAGASAPGRALILTNVQPVNAGQYWLVVSNAFGVMRSDTAVLTVTDTPPRMVFQPQSQLGPLGGGVTLRAMARGALPLQYQWRFKGENIPGATNAVLSLGPLGFEQSGNYDVIITNVFGMTVSDQALLSVVRSFVWVPYLAADSFYVPSEATNLVSVAAGNNRIVGLRNDGTVLGWNSTGKNQPSGLTDVSAVAAGGDVSLALKADGTVVAWGDSTTGQTNVPPGLTNVVAVAVGWNHCLALKSDGTVTAWGSNEDGQLNIPAGLSNVVAVTAGAYHSLVLKSDGSLVAWGTNNYGQLDIPSGISNVIAIAAGGYHNLALKEDGTVVAWGLNLSHQTDVPANLSNVVAVAPATYGNLALLADGSVVSWGQPNLIAQGLSNVTAIAAGSTVPDLHVAFIGNGSPNITVQPFGRVVERDETVQLAVRAVGRQPMRYQWQRDGQDL